MPLLYLIQLVDVILHTLLNGLPGLESRLANFLYGSYYSLEVSFYCDPTILVASRLIKKVTN